MPHPVSAENVTALIAALRTASTELEAMDARLHVVGDRTRTTDPAGKYHQLIARIEATPAKQTFTVFTVDADDSHPTTHITSVDAADIEEAKRLAITETAVDWECEESEVIVRGVSAGDTDILEWDDEGGCR